jgi:type IV pilus assembly protein PilN
MPRINLLPWREERRREQRREYLTMLGLTAGAAVLTWALVHAIYASRIEHQQSRNGYLSEQITRLDRQIKEIEALEQERARLIARMKAIESLQASRPVVVHLFDELVTTLPEGVYLTEVRQQGTVVTMHGIAESNARVSNFMRNIEDSKWLRNPRLEVIESADGAKGGDARFILRADQIVPGTSGDPA